MPDGNIAQEYSGNLPVAAVVTSMELVKLNLLMPMRERFQKQRQEVPGMLQPNMKRIPTEDVARRYRVA
jgi:hypothetical protein